MVTESGTFDTQVNIRSVVCNEVERLFDEQTHLLGTYIYTLGIGQNDYGSASAVAMFVLVLTLVLTFRYVRSLLKEEPR